MNLDKKMGWSCFSKLLQLSWRKPVKSTPQGHGRNYEKKTELSGRLISELFGFSPSEYLKAKITSSDLAIMSTDMNKPNCPKPPNVIYKT